MKAPLVPVGRFVPLTGIAGVLAVTITYLLLGSMVAPRGVPEATTWQALAVFVLLTLGGQTAYVRVRHRATTEELNFLEAVIAVALLNLPARTALVAGLLGIALAEVLLRRPLLKMTFNVGSYATAASLMLLTYYGVTGGNHRFSWQSVLAMVLSALVFAMWNTWAWSHLMYAVGGPPPNETIREGWQLSTLMAVGGVGTGMIAVVVSTEALALLPFVALPALALWYAYSAAAQHAEAKERSASLVTLGGALAQQRQGAGILAEAAESIRQVVGAPALQILEPGQTGPSQRELGILQRVLDDPGPRALSVAELPPGWQTGVVTRLDLGATEPGALLLGSTVPYRRSRVGRTRGWSLAEADAPVLGALVAAVGSAMRAGAAFDALTQQTATLSAVVDNTSDGIAMVDDTGHVRLWSQTMARMTGVDGAELEDVADVAGFPGIVRTLIDSSRTLQDRPGAIPAPVQVHLVRADGEELDVSVAAVRVRVSGPTSDGAAWVSILTVHDETRERRVERMKTDFIATISHELRTPITPIKGYAHLLSSRGDRMGAEKRQQVLQTISERADHLARLVDDLLLASKVSDGTRLAVEMGHEDLGDVVRQAVGSFPAMADRIRVDVPDGPVAIQCDRVRAIQCLSNLIGNAEKYTPADAAVEVRAEVSEMTVRIHVRDHGPGIPADKRAKVFERFYRIEDPLTMRTGGAGLGLHIARELAIAMGGGLTLQDPDSGPGAEFVLHLLTTAAPPVPGTAHPARPAAPAAPPDDTPRAAAGTHDQQSRGGATMGPPQGRAHSALSVLPATKE